MGPAAARQHPHRSRSTCRNIGRRWLQNMWFCTERSRTLLKIFSPQRQRKQGQSQDLELKHKDLDQVQGHLRSPGLRWAEDMDPDCKRIVGFFSLLQQKILSTVCWDVVLSWCRQVSRSKINIRRFGPAWNIPSSQAPSLSHLLEPPLQALASYSPS